VAACETASQRLQIAVEPQARGFNQTLGPRCSPIAFAARNKRLTLQPHSWCEAVRADPKKRKEKHYVSGLRRCFFICILTVHGFVGASSRAVPEKIES
jgi:hypothetical protein